MRRNLAFGATLAAVVALDQLTKAMVSNAMTLGQSIRVIDGFFSLTYIRNTGIAFGLLNNGVGWLKTTLLGLATLAAMGFLLWLLSDLRRDDLWGGLNLGLVGGGALGNLVDRLRAGEVVDFLDVYWRTHHWPFFNLADSAITVGVVLLIVQQLFFHQTEG